MPLIAPINGVISGFTVTLGEGVAAGLVVFSLAAKD
jgi:multidrug resistance efflux pump